MLSNRYLDWTFGPAPFWNLQSSKILKVKAPLHDRNTGDSSDAFDYSLEPLL